MTHDEMELHRLRELVTIGSGTSACPSAEALARAASGESSASERAAIAEHLGTCSSCSEDYRVAASLRKWADSAAESIPLTKTTRATRVWSPTVAYAAAAVAIAAVGTALVLWNWSLREENGRLLARLREAAPSVTLPRQDDSEARLKTQAAEIATLQARLDDTTMPALNLPIVDLLPRDAQRGASAAAVTRVPAGATQVIFVITTAADPPDRDHELEITGPRGDVLWRGTGLRPNRERTFTVAVPRALLPAGTCRLQLSDLRNGKAVVVGNYTVRVEP
jgi:hypothetical protein